MKTLKKIVKEKVKIKRVNYLLLPVIAITECIVRCSVLLKKIGEVMFKGK
jgi:hypothetical protein